MFRHYLSVGWIPFFFELCKVLEWVKTYEYHISGNKLSLNQLFGWGTLQVRRALDFLCHLVSHWHIARKISEGEDRTLLRPTARPARPAYGWSPSRAVGVWRESTRNFAKIRGWVKIYQYLSISINIYPSFGWNIHFLMGFFHGDFWWWVSLW